MLNAIVKKENEKKSKDIISNKKYLLLVKLQIK